nr:PREDICTED: uncharacterized protein C7orf50 homolog [Balearica regulorum gibbericeps]
MALSYLVNQQIHAKPQTIRDATVGVFETVMSEEEGQKEVLQDVFNSTQATKKEEELTAEERRKLERKLKKERKKKEKQLMREAGISTKKAEPKKQSGSELALAYLTSWSENPEEWKFQKTRQTWLLLHMYDKEKVPDEYFTILLDYLQGLQGGARDITVQKAEAFMKELDDSDAEDPNLLEKCERIRQVLQLLS